MCSQVYFKPSHRCIERELESSAKTKASTPLHQLILRRRSEQLSNFGIIFTHILFAKEEKVVKRACISLKYPFLAIHAKGEKVLAQRKRTAPPPDFKITIFTMVSYCVQKGERVVFSKLVS